MGPEFPIRWTAPTLALAVALVGCSSLKSDPKAIATETTDGSAGAGGDGGPIASASGGNSGRGGRPGWGGDEPAGVGGAQGTGSGGMGGSDSGGSTGSPGAGGSGGNDGGPSGLGGDWGFAGSSGGTNTGGRVGSPLGGAGGGTGGRVGSPTGGSGGNSAGGSTGTGAGGSTGGSTGGSSGSGAGGSTGGGGAGGIKIPGNDDNGTGGITGEGPFVPPNPSDDCAHAPSLPLKLPRMNLPVDTRGAAANMTASCGAAGPDVFYSFNLSSKQAVYADTFGSSWNTMVFFAKSCDGTPANGGPTACNDDACGTQQSQAVAILPAGKYYLVISGAQGQSGATTVHFEHTPLGNGPVGVVAPGTSTLTGTTSGAGSLEFCEAGSSDNSYWWATCPSFTAAPFTAASCDGTTFDTVLSLQVPRAGLAMCNDDACGFQSRVSANVAAGAGLNVVSIDGSTGRQAGEYSLTVTRP
jgi:hypothetical protein